MKKDEELFVHYGYPQRFAPKWYRELYKEFAKQNPEKASKKLEVNTKRSFCIPTT